MIETTPDQLAVFIQEYIRREQQSDAGVLAVIAADLRDSQWPPHHVAELLLARSDVQAAIKAAKSFYKPPEIKEISPQTISADYETIFQKAREDRQYGAAIQAKKAQAEIHGFTSKDVNINITHRVEDMSTAQLLQIASRAGKETVIDTDYTEVATDS